MFDRLSEDQRQVLNIVREGHNAFITGQGGTGKSFLVKEIYKELTRSGKRVAIICSSGIAGTVYDGHASTVHSFYGLKTAELPWEQVVKRSVSNSVVSENAKNINCLIWDEVSMSSRRILEIVNHIQLEITQGTENCGAKPLGGIQVIMVGEFTQLSPVPNLMDDGQFMFRSSVFKKAMPHRFELKKLMRQNQEEQEFLECQRDLRLGKCTKKTEEFITSLERPLPEDLKEEAIHIFFKRVPSQVFNRERLNSIVTDEHRYEATDKGDTKDFSCPAEYHLRLKPGCKVMLIWNKSDKLKNGTAGKYVGKEGDTLVVEFKDVGKVKLGKVVWEKRGRHGDIVGSRTQYPVVLMYGITCHKAQGLTLPAVVLHSCNEFVPGLLYVAFSRVQSAAHLQVLNFASRQVIPAVKECIDVCKGHQGEVKKDLSCCRNTRLSVEELAVQENININEFAATDDTPHLTDELNEVFEQVISSYFKREDPAEQMLDLATLYAVLADDQSQEFVQNPPDSLSVNSLLKSMVVQEPITEYAKSKNLLIQELLDEPDDDLEVIGKVLWCRAGKIVIEETLSATDGDQLHISPHQWTLNTRQLHMFLTRSPDFMSDMKLFFKVTELSSLQLAVGNELMIEVYKIFISSLAAHVINTEASHPMTTRVNEMPSETLAKVRYVGAWAITKVLHDKLTYIKQFMNSSNNNTLKSVKTALYLTSLIEENLIASNFENLQVTTANPETLTVTEERQYRCRGLAHIVDPVYEFFVDLEQARVEQLNNEKLTSSKERLVEDAIIAVSSNANLQTKWRSCFQGNVDQVHGNR